jgi:hypothetical protein
MPNGAVNSIVAHRAQRRVPHNALDAQLQVTADVCAAAMRIRLAGANRFVREATEVMEDNGPPVSACRGRHQTTIERL